MKFAESLRFGILGYLHRAPRCTCGKMPRLHSNIKYSSAIKRERQYYIDCECGQNCGFWSASKEDALKAWREFIANERGRKMTNEDAK